MKLVGQNILEKCRPKFFVKTMYSINLNILHLGEGVSLNLERYGFPRNSRFRTKVKPHLSRRHYSGNLLSGQKVERTNLQYFIHTIKWHTGKAGLWTNDLDT